MHNNYNFILSFIFVFKYQGHVYNNFESEIGEL